MALRIVDSDGRRGNDIEPSERIMGNCADGANQPSALRALSSTDFLHKENTVVKNTTKTKMRKKSRKVEKDYVN